MVKVKLPKKKRIDYSNRISFSSKRIIHRIDKQGMGIPATDTIKTFTIIEEHEEIPVDFLLSSTGGTGGRRAGLVFPPFPGRERVV